MSSTNSPSSHFKQVCCKTVHAYTIHTTCVHNLKQAARMLTISLISVSQAGHIVEGDGGGGQCPCLELALLTASRARSGKGILVYDTRVQSGPVMIQACQPCCTPVLWRAIPQQDLGKCISQVEDNGCHYIAPISSPSLCSQHYLHTLHLDLFRDPSRQLPCTCSTLTWPAITSKSQHSSCTIKAASFLFRHLSSLTVTSDVLCWEPQAHHPVDIVQSVNCLSQ